jgi:hypothetical protein
MCTRTPRRRSARDHPRRTVSSSRGSTLSVVGSLTVVGGNEMQFSEPKTARVLRVSCAGFYA